MNNIKKFTGLGAALAMLLCLASAPASAIPITFTFSGAGSVDSVSSCGSNCYQLSTNGLAVETGGLTGVNAWDFQGVMRFSSLHDQTGNGSGAGLGWYFNDLTGGNDLWGTLTSTMNNGFTLFDWLIDGALGTGTLNYTVSGGSGLFANSTGYGQSSITYTGLLYVEQGWMTADVRSVPEPGTLALLGTALAALGFVGTSRRRRPVVKS